MASAPKLFYRKESIAKLTDFLDENFIEKHKISTIKGRLIVTGIGKSYYCSKWSQHLTRLERHRYFFMPQRQYTGI
jgi:D-arabinose 5-phosphate isomerase GutQ